MKSFLEKIQEDAATHLPVVMAFGRMNPPTIGHEKLVNRVKEIAKDYRAPHHVIISHSVDIKKNPLSPAQKVKHASRFFPNTNIETSSKESPTFLHHAARLNAAGHDHLVMVAGSDRVQEYQDKLNQYNGTGPGKLFNFKKIEVKSAGQRDPDAEGTEGMSASKMREHAKNNDFTSFKQGVPNHLPEKHARELFRDVRKGMGLNEQVNRGLFKAIFVTGGPGSGKDVVLREAIAEQKVVEINVSQAFDLLADKKQLSEKTNDYRREAIRNRGPLIINGPADHQNEIIWVKEELEELGYNTMMVFVDTTNEASQSRNEKLTKMIAESVRYDKWVTSQTGKMMYQQSFGNFNSFDNSGTIENIEEDITELYHKINDFIDNKSYMAEAYRWMETHGKLNTNDSINILVKEENNVKKDSRFIQRLKESRGPKLTRGTGGRAENLGDIIPDNRKIGVEKDEIKGNFRPRKGKDFASSGHSGGAWSGAYSTNEETKSELKKFSQPKESKFSQDADKLRRLKKGDKSIKVQQFSRPSGIGQEYDTRAGGQNAAAGAGLGNQTYSEDTLGPTASNSDVINFAAIAGGPKPNPLETAQNKKFNRFRKSIKEWNGAQNEPESGFAGTLGGADNKEPMESPKDKVGYTYNSIRKRKNGVKK